MGNGEVESVLMEIVGEGGGRNMWEGISKVVWEDVGLGGSWGSKVDE